MKNKEIKNLSPVPDWWSQELRTIFKEDIDKLSNKMKNYMLDQIKGFPKSQQGWVRNRIEIRIQPIVLMYMNPK